MIKLLRCPEISFDRLRGYLDKSNNNQQFSNFGYCEQLLRERLSKYPAKKFIKIKSRPTFIKKIIKNK